MFALFYSSLRFTEGGREGGSDLPTQNYKDIGEITISAQNYTDRKTSALPMKKPSRLREGWVGSQRILKIEHNKKPRHKTSVFVYSARIADKADYTAALPIERISLPARISSRYFSMLSIFSSVRVAETPTSSGRWQSEPMVSGKPYSFATCMVFSL